MKVVKCKSHELWLGKRVIGGSSAAAVVGENPYKSKQKLYRELIGEEKPEDISNKPYVIFGKKAEEHLRKLFALKYTDFEVIEPKTIEKDGYIELFVGDKEFMTATLDGELDHKELGHGGIEIKTSEIINTLTKEKWKDGRIPMNYYCQILHYFAVRPDIKYFVLYAYLSYSNAEGETWQYLRPYFFSRENCEKDIKWLVEQEEIFWNEYVIKKVEPPLELKI